MKTNYILSIYFFIKIILLSILLTKTIISILLIFKQILVLWNEIYYQNSQDMIITRIISILKLLFFSLIIDNIWLFLYLLFKEYIFYYFGFIIKYI